MLLVCNCLNLNQLRRLFARDRREGCFRKTVPRQKGREQPGEESRGPHWRENCDACNREESRGTSRSYSEICRRREECTQHCKIYDSCCQDESHRCSFSEERKQSSFSRQGRRVLLFRYGRCRVETTIKKCQVARKGGKGSKHDESFIGRLQQRGQGFEGEDRAQKGGSDRKG